MDQWFIRLDPGKPVDFYTFQEFFLLSVAILRKDEDVRRFKVTQNTLPGVHSKPDRAYGNKVLHRDKEKWYSA